MDERWWGHVRPLTDEDRAAVQQVDPDAVRESLHYALRFDERGKVRGPQVRADANLTSIWLVRHLLKSGYVIVKRPVKAGCG